MSEPFQALPTSLFADLPSGCRGDDRRRADRMAIDAQATGALANSGRKGRAAAPVNSPPWRQQRDEVPLVMPVRRADGAGALGSYASLDENSTLFGRLPSG